MRGRKVESILACLSDALIGFIFKKLVLEIWDDGDPPLKRIDRSRKFAFMNPSNLRSGVSMVLGTSICLERTHIWFKDARKRDISRCREGNG